MSGHVKVKHGTSTTISLATILLLLTSITFMHATQPSCKRVVGEITTTWDGQPLEHDRLVNLEVTGFGDELEITVEAPFFDADAVPPCRSRSCPKLWNFEVVEVVFFSEEHHKPIFTKIILSPYGKYLVLLLEGDADPTQGRIIAQGFPIDYEWTTDTDTHGHDVWHGVAKIPITYFPPHVVKWNAFARHVDTRFETGHPVRRYQSLFPVPAGTDEKHNFQSDAYFEPINFARVFPNYRPSEISKVWRRALSSPSSTGPSGEPPGRIVVLDLGDGTRRKYSKRPLASGAHRSPEYTTEDPSGAGRTEDGITWHTGDGTGEGYNRDYYSATRRPGRPKAGTDYTE